MDNEPDHGVDASAEEMTRFVAQTSDGWVTLEMLLLSLEHGEQPTLPLITNLENQFCEIQSRIDDTRLSALFERVGAVFQRWASGHQSVDHRQVECLLAVIDFLRQWSPDCAAACDDLSLGALMEGLQEVLGETPPQTDQWPAVTPAQVAIPLRLAFQRLETDRFSRTLAQILDYGSRLNRRMQLPARRGGQEDWERFQEAVGDLNHWALTQYRVPGLELAQRISALGEEVAQRQGGTIRMEVQHRGIDWDPDWVEPLLKALEIWFDFAMKMQLRVGSSSDLPLENLLVWVSQDALGGYVVRIKDNGPGLDPEVLLRRAVELGMVESTRQAAREYGMFLFDRRWSFSEAPGVTQRLFELRRILHGLGGQLALASRPGKGMLCEMKFPPVSALFQGVEVMAGSCRAVIPMFFIQEMGACQTGELERIHSGAWYLNRRGKNYRAFSLEQLMGKRDGETLQPRLAILTEYDGRSVALLVDHLADPRTEFLQKLERHHQRIYGLLGVMVNETDEVLQVLNISELLEAVW